MINKLFNFYVKIKLKIKINEKKNQRKLLDLKPRCFDYQAKEFPLS